MSRCYICLIFLCTTGCAFPYASGEANPDLAEKTLIEALNAWESRELPLLEKRDTPIRFADDDQVAGCQLLAYEVESSRVQQFLPFKDVKVKLTLKDVQGKTIEKTVSYQITIEPALSVLRSNN